MGDSGLYVQSATAQTNNTGMLHVNLTNASSTCQAMKVSNAGTGNSLLIDHNNSGTAINIDMDMNTAAKPIGIAINIANSGSGGERAFTFSGSEVVASAVGGTQNRKVKCEVGGTIYYLAFYTA